jgi:hypothetical protein
MVLNAPPETIRGTRVLPHFLGALAFFFYRRTA